MVSTSKTSYFKTCSISASLISPSSILELQHGGNEFVRRFFYGLMTTFYSSSQKLPFISDLSSAIKMGQIQLCACF